MFVFGSVCLNWEHVFVFVFGAGGGVTVSHAARTRKFSEWIWMRVMEIFIVWMVIAHVGLQYKL